MPPESNYVAGREGIGRGRIWLTAIRPRTLTIAVTPVVLATALAWSDGASVQWHVLVLIVLCAMLIQAGTNLHNDAADFERGTDDASRVGPLRVTAAGWIPATAVYRATWLAYGCAAVLGMYLVALGGWWIAAAGLASLAVGWSYSGGKHPLSHSMWGECVVFVFFGLVAVVGTYWLHTQSLTLGAVLCGTALGLPAAGVLLVNNFRDKDSDVRAGRRTLAYRLGDAGAKQLYATLLLLPFAVVIVLAWRDRPYCVAALVLLPHAVSLTGRLSRSASAASLNGLLGATARLELLLGLFVAFGVVL